MTQHWFKTVDFQPPTLPAIQQGLDVLEQARTSGHSVYVHCKAGKGRSAVVTACYLMKVCMYMYGHKNTHANRQPKVYRLINLDL